MARLGVKRFLLLNYIPLYYFQELIDKRGIYYDRDRFRRIRDANSFTIDANPAHLRLVKYFFAAIIVRGCTILFVPWATRTRERRIVLVGTELMKDDRPYIETTVLFWACISYSFFQYTLSSSLLDYKFLALFRMSDSNSLHYSKFGLSKSDFEEYRTFRSRALFYYNLIMLILPPFASVASFIMLIRADLYIPPYFFISCFWSFVLFYYLYIVCSVIYSNLVAFIVVVKYIHIKQRFLTVAFRDFMGRISWSRHIKAFNYDQIRWKQFLTQNERYAQLYAELDDYNRHFWCSYISAIFFFYVLLISFILYVCLFGRATVLMNFAYFICGNFHVFLLSVVIYLCGGIVQSNARLSMTFATNIARWFQREARISTTKHLKIHNFNEYLDQLSQSGFTLINGYLITHDTFRLLIVNAALYFLLIIRKDRF